MSRPLSIRLDEGILCSVEMEASRDGITQSECLRRVIRRGLGLPSDAVNLRVGWCADVVKVMAAASQMAREIKLACRDVKALASDDLSAENRAKIHEVYDAALAAVAELNRVREMLGGMTPRAANHARWMHDTYARLLSEGRVKEGQIEATKEMVAALSSLGFGEKVEVKNDN
jgi:hypothetical protein